MKIYKLQHNSPLVGFWIPSLQLFWASYFVHLPTYPLKSACWPKVSKENWEKLEKDEDTQHHEAT